MPIETTCQTCGKQLRVGDEHVGKLARCPACQTIYTVPSSSLPTALPTVPPAQPLIPELKSAIGTLEMDRWHLRTPEGMTFGPVSKAVLDQWQREGRIVRGAHLIQDGNSQWISAAAIYPHLAAAPVGNPFADFPTPTPNADAPPPSGAYWSNANARYLEPHRGGLILTLGIVGFFFCAIIGLIAIVLGATDLQKMAQGRMDPSGRGLTIAGLVMGSIQMLMLLFYIVIMIIANAR